MEAHKIFRALRNVSLKPTSVFSVSLGQAPRGSAEVLKHPVPNDSFFITVLSVIKYAGKRWNHLGNDTAKAALLKPLGYFLADFHGSPCSVQSTTGY